MGDQTTVRELLKKEREDAMKREKKLNPTDVGCCTIFTSYYCPAEIFDLADKLSKFDERKEEIEEICKELPVKDRVTAVMNHEFSAHAMFYVGFSMGFLMGQNYGIKDRELLPRLKKLFFDTITQTERKAAEKKGVPYIGKATERLEKRVA